MVKDDQIPLAVPEGKLLFEVGTKGVDQLSTGGHINRGEEAEPLDAREDAVGLLLVVLNSQLFGDLCFEFLI